MLNWKKHKHKKEKKKLFVNTTVLTALVTMTVLFSAFFIFAVFQTSIFRDILIGFQKWKLTKYQSKKKQQDAKQNEIEYYDSNKTRQQAEKQKQKNNLKKQIKPHKNQEPETEMRNRKEERKEQERDKERESEKGGGPKKAKRKQRRSQKNTQKCPSWGETGFFY